MHQSARHTPANRCRNQPAAVMTDSKRDPLASKSPGRCEGATAVTVGHCGEGRGLGCWYLDWRAPVVPRGLVASSTMFSIRMQELVKTRRGRTVVGTALLQRSGIGLLAWRPTYARGGRTRAGAQLIRHLFGTRVAYTLCGRPGWATTCLFRSDQMFNEERTPRNGTRTVCGCSRL